jgi:hypothetical protein
MSDGWTFFAVFQVEALPVWTEFFKDGLECGSSACADVIWVEFVVADRR